MWVLRAERPAKVCFEIFFGITGRVGFFNIRLSGEMGTVSEDGKVKNIKGTTNKRGPGSSSMSLNCVSTRGRAPA